MTSFELVRQVLVIIAMLLAATMLVTLARAAALAWYGPHNRRQLAQARRILVRTADTRGENLGALDDLPYRVQVAAFVELTRNVTGRELENLRIAAERIGITRRARRLCRSRHWWRRLHGARILTLLDRESAIISLLVRDRNALVRAQAAEWITGRPDDTRIAMLLELVHDRVAFVQFSAKDALLRIGAPAVPQVVAALEAAPATRALPLLEVAAGMPAARMLEPALHFARSENAAIRAAAAAVLGGTGGQAAADRLQELLADPDDQVRAQAAAALGKLEQWATSTQLARLLNDSVWDVRRHAALALRSLGAPGELMLSRASRGDQPAAAAIARQVLGLPARQTLT